MALALVNQLTCQSVRRLSDGRWTYAVDKYTIFFFVFHQAQFQQGPYQISGLGTEAPRSVGFQMKIGVMCGEGKPDPL